MTAKEDDAARRAARLRRTGELLFGERWQSPVAELLRVSQPTIANIVSGQKGLSPDLENRLGQMCIDQADALSRKSIELARLAIEIADERRRRPFDHMRGEPTDADIEASYAATAAETSAAVRPRPWPPKPLGQERSSKPKRS